MRADAIRVARARRKLAAEWRRPAIDSMAIEVFAESLFQFDSGLANDTGPLLQSSLCACYRRRPDKRYMVGSSRAP